MHRLTWPCGLDSRRDLAQTSGMAKVAKVPSGVGPRNPQVLTLVGGSGDLAQRKLWPGLFHLISSGFIPSCRLIGVSLDQLDADGFRALVRSALEKFSPRKANGGWAQFAELIDYVPISAGAAALHDAVGKAEAELGAETRRLHYLSVPPNAALPAVRLLSDAGLIARSRVVIRSISLSLFPLRSRPRASSFARARASSFARSCPRFPPFARFPPRPPSWARKRAREHTHAHARAHTHTLAHMCRRAASLSRPLARLLARPL